MKRCCACKEVKSIENFTSDKSRSDGKYPRCKQCSSAYHANRVLTDEQLERRRIYQREYARTDRRKRKIKEYQSEVDFRLIRFKSKIKAKYGLTIEEYTAILEAQGHSCAICSDRLLSTKHTHTDHCHKTGKVRGILCHNCNRALGGARDSVEILRSMIRYLDANA